MKLQMLASAALAVLFSVNVMAADADATYEADCKKYAVEDGIPAAEMEEYLAQCMADMTAASEAEAGAGQQGSSQE
jgi:hypothetical protein